MVEGPNAQSTSVFVNEDYDLTSVDNCAQPTRHVAHVSLPSSEPKLQVAAHRNNQPIKLEVRSELARVGFPDGQPGRLHLLMLYDSTTKLFWWTCWPLLASEPDSAGQKDTENLLDRWSVFITDDRIAVFSSVSVLDSTEHYPDFQAARSHVVSVLEATRGNIQAASTLGISTS
jgi:hypothetical protein